MAADDSWCLTDFDCSGTKICYNGTKWATDHGIYCSCSAWWGWVGDCTELGPQAIFTLSFDVVMLLASAVASLAGIYSLGKLAVQSGGTGNKLLNPTNVTAILATLGLLSIFTWRAVSIAATLTPNDLTTRGKVAEEKFHVLTAYNRIAASLSTLFGTLAGLNVGITWIDVADATLRNKNYARMSSIYRQVVHLVEIFFSIGVVAFMANDRPEYVTALAFPVLMFIAITFTAGRFKMRALLKGVLESLSGLSTAAVHTASSERYAELLAKICFTSKVAVIFVSLTAVFGVVYMALSLFNWRQYVRPDGLGPVVIVNELTIFFMMCSVLTVQWYCVSNIKTTFRRVAESIGTKRVIAPFSSMQGKT